jgi:hypothetical protein
MHNKLCMIMTHVRLSCFDSPIKNQKSAGLRAVEGKTRFVVYKTNTKIHECLEIDGIYPSSVEKISLSFAALTRSISFSTLEINFIYFFAVRYPCLLANQTASFAVQFFTIRTAQPDRCGF